MRRTVRVSLHMLLAFLSQACQRKDPTAPPLSADAVGEANRAPAQLAFTVQPPVGVAANGAISPALQVSVTDASGDVGRRAGYVRVEIGSSPATGAASRHSRTFGSTSRGGVTRSGLAAEMCPV